MGEDTQKRSASTSKGSSEAGAMPAVHQAAEQVRSAATERVDSARAAAESAKARAADRVRKLGSAVRKIGEHMRIEDQLYIADRANDTGRRLDAVADYIADAELGTLVRDAEDVARRRPALVFGGALLVGLAAGRFLKSSGGRERERDTGARR